MLFSGGAFQILGSLDLRFQAGTSVEMQWCFRFFAVSAYVDEGLASYIFVVLGGGAGLMSGLRGILNGFACCPALGSCSHDNDLVGGADCDRGSNGFLVALGMSGVDE